MAIPTRASTKLDYETQDITDKSIVVTGGTTGIGRATALLLAAHGARVLIFGIEEQELNDAMQDLRDVSDQVYGLTADQSHDEDVQRVFREADRRMDGVDILINNAALPGKGIMDEGPQAARYIVETNLLGYMTCAYEAAKRMKERGQGHIVNIGSMSAEVREKGSSVYVATKAGIRGFSASLRKELNEHGIKVSLIEPGSVGTELSGDTPDEQEQAESDLELLKAEDIASAVYYTITQPERSDVVMVQIRPHLQKI
jgi:NADP-dependent 3-hydroxy acid dehydrogenase YdfG